MIFIGLSTVVISENAFRSNRYFYFMLNLDYFKCLIVRMYYILRTTIFEHNLKPQSHIYFPQTFNCLLSPPTSAINQPCVPTSSRGKELWLLGPQITLHVAFEKCWHCASSGVSKESQSSFMASDFWDKQRKAFSKLFVTNFQNLVCINDTRANGSLG